MFDDWHQQYPLDRYPFMAPQSPEVPRTETYVSIPSALYIRDSEGAVWTFGFDYDEVAWRSGRWEYDVVRNGRVTGAFARRIECRLNSYGNRVVRICGADSGGRWRIWNGRTFV